MKKKTPGHTPGPWTYDAEAAEILPGPGTDKNFVGRFHSGRNDAGNDARPTKADAALIAAAPEMLAALESLEWAGYHEDHYSLCPSCGNRKLARNPKHKEDCLLANAIAKAEGKKP
jgi:hypothetical protein